MSFERGEQGLREIGIEPQVFAQLGHTQIFGADVGAAQAERRFAPILDRQGRKNLFLGDVSASS